MDVCFTWLGPPQPMNKSVSGVGPARPDLFGLLRTASARFRGGGPPPNFKLCCLKKYAAAFRSQVPGYVDVMVLEDAFSSKDTANLNLLRPDMNRLDVCVDFITRTILGVRGTAYPDDALPKGQLAFVKDIWSLYYIWRFGGYHIDAGCFPDGKYGGVVNLPPPTEFGVPVVGPPPDRGGSSTPFHGVVRFPNGGPAMCATLCGGWAGMNGAIAAATLGAQIFPTGRGNSHMNRQVDVWLLRGPGGDAVSEMALKFYIQGWFAMRDANFLNAQSYRELVVAAVATAITHAGATRGSDGEYLTRCRDANEWKKHIFEALDGDVPSLGLRKVGFQSHA